MRAPEVRTPGGSPANAETQEVINKPDSCASGQAQQPLRAIEADGAQSLPADPLKPWRTAQAEAILAKFSATLTRTDDGRPELIVSRWALTRSFTDLAELEAWLGRVGARR